MHSFFQEGRVLVILLGTNSTALFVDNMIVDSANCKDLKYKIANPESPFYRYIKPQYINSFVDGHFRFSLLDNYAVIDFNYVDSFDPRFDSMEGILARNNSSGGIDSSCVLNPKYYIISFSLNNDPDSMKMLYRRFVDRDSELNDFCVVKISNSMGLLRHIRNSADSFFGNKPGILDEIDYRLYWAAIDYSDESSDFNEYANSHVFVKPLKSKSRYVKSKTNGAILRRHIHLNTDGVNSFVEDYFEDGEMVIDFEIEKELRLVLEVFDNDFEEKNINLFCGGVGEYVKICKISEIKC